MIAEILIGIDSVEIEDNLIQLDITRKKEFLNVRNFRITHDPKSDFVVDGSDPVLIYFFMMTDKTRAT